MRVYPEGINLSSGSRLLTQKRQEDPWLKKLMAPWPVAAWVLFFLCCSAGAAAAGVAEFLFRRAFIPVAGAARRVRVLLPAGTGMGSLFVGV
jgi:hypothetical protein